MLSSPELQAIPHRNRIRALAASAASLLLMSTLTLTVHAERFNEPTVNVVAANAPQIGNVVLTECLNNPTTCIPEITLPPTTTTLPKPAAAERPTPNKPSRSSAPRLAPTTTTSPPVSASSQGEWTAPEGCMVPMGPTEAKSIEEAHYCWDGLLALYPWPQREAFATMYCESKGNPYADNPSSSAESLFQVINGPEDPEQNVAVAYNMFSRRGWQPWETCPRHKYLEN